MNTRWARFGPYYAMFPVEFAFGVIEKYSSLHSKTRLLDPFAGRGTSIYAAASLGWEAVGVEINPVGWVYGKTKLRPAPLKKVLNRLDEISGLAYKYKSRCASLPEFFKVCFCEDTLKFLLSARENLNWKNNNSDRTLVSFILYYLHNNIGEGLSNQMKQTIAMAPNYSLRWWKANGFTKPPEIDPNSFLRKRIEWRYAKGTPQITVKGKMFLGDSEKKLNQIVNQTNGKDKFSLLLTSPPYCSVVDYHYDQWLRLWVLGGEDFPTVNKDKNKGRFVSKQNYYKLLLNVFSKCSKIMKPDGVIYVRTDVRKFTFECTREVLKTCFPKHTQKISDSKPKKSQSLIYKNISSIRPGERDIVLTR